MQFFRYTSAVGKIDQDYSTEKIKNFLKELGNPEKDLKNVIHVTGTNGKGSTCNFIKTGLEKSGYTVNLFTSPHLYKINERIRIKDKMISDKKLAKIDSFLEEKFANKNITFFEAVTLAAILVFKESGADFNIFEVGCGGRHDATNIFEKKIASVITSISKDHTKILGDTIEKIAAEKVAILEKGGNIFISEQKNSVLEVIKNFTKNQNGNCFFENENWEIFDKNGENFYKDKEFEIKIHSSLRGDHQINNAALAAAVLVHIKKNGYIKITKETIEEGISNTYWPGRIQNINIDGFESNILIDGAHNQDGIAKFMDYIDQTNSKYKKNIAFFTTLDNKQIEDFVPSIKNKFDMINVISFQKNELGGHKFHLPEFIFEKFKENKILSQVVQFKNIKKIIKKDFNDRGYRIVFFGSLYFIGEILKKYDRKKIR